MPSKCTHTTLQREQLEALIFPLYVRNQKLADIFRVSPGCMVKSRRHRTSHRTGLHLEGMHLSQEGGRSIQGSVTHSLTYGIHQAQTVWVP